MGVVGTVGEVSIITKLLSMLNMKSLFICNVILKWLFAATLRLTKTPISPF